MDRATTYGKLIEEFFGDAGALAHTIPNYRRRDGQVQLVRDIWETATRGGILLAEGPTGCGKSFAYGIPAIARAIMTGRPSLIVTANKALQDQLAEKDLPTLQQALQGTPFKNFKFAVLKGRANYVCRRELAMYDSGGISWPYDLVSEGNAIRTWVRDPTCSGDRNDAPHVSDKTWRLVSITGDDCDRRACAHYSTCFAEKALENADGAHVVIANYDLLFAKLLHGDAAFWRKFGMVILDEAHEAATIARRCFGTEISEGTLRRMASTLSDRFGERELARRLRETAAPTFEKIADYALGVRGGRLSDPGFVNVDDLVEVLDEVAAIVAGGCGRCVEGESCSECANRQRIHDRAREVAAALVAFVEQSDDLTAYWIDKPLDATRVTGATVKLCAAPYRVGDQLRQTVFSQYESIVCISATMTAGGSFDFIRGELGLDNAEMTSKLRLSRVASPFDYAKQAKFVIPFGIPLPSSENESLFDAAIAKALVQIVNDSQGRTLALFTSWRRLRYVADYLRDKISYPLLVQGEGSNKLLAQRFRQETDSVLLATRSFWTGLDVAGESLSCLVIDKLPFDSFDDPFVDMMKTKHPNTYYEEFYVPRAAIALAQGAGRLIRRADDYGVFVLLDQRIKVKRYGRQFLASLPFKGFSQDLADVGKFLAEKAAR